MPLITWIQKDLGEVDYSYSRFKTNKRTLKIKDVGKDDTGSYICKAVNGFGNVEVMIDLIILHQDDFQSFSYNEKERLSPPRMAWGNDGVMNESLV